MRLVLDVELPGDGWTGQPAAELAEVTAQLTARLLELREVTGCDLAGYTGLKVGGEYVGGWTVTL